MNSFEELYKNLNTYQAEAVDALDGPLLVLAGPGTGKTQLLSIRTANIINKNKANPENILILTFSNAAAKAMRDRLTGLIGHNGYYVGIETFHSFANSIVLECEEALKYVSEKIEISELEKIRALEYILDNVKGAEFLRPFGAPYIHRSEIEKRISELKNEGILPGDLKNKIKTLVPDGISLEEKHISRLNALSLIYENYERMKNEDANLLFDDRGRIDYDDMILIALDSLKKDKELRDRLKKQYKYVMVDEFQDTNGAQLELLFSIISEEKQNICCVGDDDQAIYRFQGATLSNFRHFKEKYSLLKTIKLEDNYRSTEDIINFNANIIGQLPEKERVSVKSLCPGRKIESGEIKFLEFRTQEEELSFLVNKIMEVKEQIENDKNLSKEERAKPFNNIAVLVRKRSQMLLLIDAFLRAGVPYATDGKEDIRSEKRVRQMLDVLELVGIRPGDNKDRSLPLYKVLSADYVGAEQSDILSILGQFNSKRGNEKKDFFTEFLSMFPVDIKNMPSAEESEKLDVTKKLRFKNAFALHRSAWAIQRLLQDRDTRPVHDILMSYIEDMNLYRFILEKYEKEKLLRIRDLRALISFINMIKKSDITNPALRLEQFLEELEIREVHGMPINGEIATLSQDGVRMYTSHASKGLEFHTVFIPFCLERESWPVRRKGAVVPLPVDVIASKEKVNEKDGLKMLDLHDELRLFYVASTRARQNLYYTAYPRKKTIVSRFLVNIDIEAGVDSRDEETLLETFISGVKADDFTPDTEALLKDMVSNLTLNPTSLNNYINCKRKFLYDNVLRLPGKKNQHLAFGNCAHKALEEVYGKYKDTGTFPHFGFFKRIFERELKFQGVSDQIEKWCLDRLETLKNWYTLESKNPVVPVELETKLDIPLGEGLIFKGTFDKIEVEADENITVVDYKTGKPDKHIKAIFNCEDLGSPECDDYYRQLIAYKLLYDRAKKVKVKGTVTKGVLQFLEPVGESVKKYALEKGKYIKKTVYLNDDQVEELESLILRSWKDIQRLKFDKLPERDSKRRCVMCPFDMLCWGD